MAYRNLEEDILGAYTAEIYDEFDEKCLPKNTSTELGWEYMCKYLFKWKVCDTLNFYRSLNIQTIKF